MRERAGGSEELRAFDGQRDDLTTTAPATRSAAHRTACRYHLLRPELRARHRRLEAMPSRFRSIDPRPTFHP
jgi:hypothetical protein